MKGTLKQAPVHQILQLVAALESSHLEKYVTIPSNYLRCDVCHFRKRKWPKMCSLNRSKCEEKNIVGCLMLHVNNTENPFI